MKKIDIDIDVLTDLYVNQRYTQQQLADFFSVSKTLINRRLKQLNISKPKLTKEFLHEHYIDKNLTQAQIAKIAGISAASIGVQLRKFNINKPTKISTHKNEIITLFKSGESYYSISKKLGCSLSTIYTVLEQAGLKQVTKIYNDFEESLLRHLYIDLDYSLAELAKHLNCSVTEANLNILHYNIKKAPKEYDIALITDLYLNKSMKQVEISAKLNIPVPTLQNVISKNNINKPASKINIELLKELCTTELSIQEIADELGFSRTYIGQIIAKNNIFRESLNKETSIERFVKSCLTELGVEFIQNDRLVLEGKELDFYIPSKQLGIEVCGLYWHGSKINSNKYHIFSKYELAKNKNIQLLTIFEDEVVDKPNIVLQRLATKLGYNKQVTYARNTNVEIITPRVGIDFLNKYHIQGSGKNSIYLGLRHKDSIVAVMSFSRSTIAKGKAAVEWELNRFASIGTVVGGASKLLSFFKKTYNPKSIISYSDNRWNSGNVYKQLGFKFQHESAPNYWYIVNQQRKHRFTYTKHKLLEIFKDANPLDTEESIAEAHGLHRIYDCGNTVYMWQAE